ncbi:MAG: hypothetical protein ACREOP_05800 [Thermodesulfobacteriota bacterium]
MIEILFSGIFGSRLQPFGCRSDLQPIPMLCPLGAFCPNQWIGPTAERRARYRRLYPLYRGIPAGEEERAN